MKHLPATREEFIATSWDRADFVFIIGEAYVDHASFGHAIISRLLEDAGYKVAIISLPDYNDPESITIYGEPRLGFLVSSGNIDSMVNHYTAAKKKRSKDSYAPEDRAGLRPDRATIVYSNLIRKTYKTAPIILGGVEASLRRFAHYDYWHDRVRHAILEDANADILVYGMGERAMIEIATLLEKGVPIDSITNIKGTCYITNECPPDATALQDFATISSDKREFAKCFMQQYRNLDPITGLQLAQKQHRKIIVQNPPQSPLTQQEMDRVYELPYTRCAHPMYGKQGISALTEVKFSLTSCRGCFGSCNFCSLSFHQGRNIATRSHESLIQEAKLLTSYPDFKGYIHDVGGPTANFRHAPCTKQSKHGSCSDQMCLYPTPCRNLDTSHSDYLSLLKQLRSIEGIKKVFIRSGLRYDYILEDQDSNHIISEISKHHISGRLKIAPEHISQRVLSAMGKPKKEVYSDFVAKYENINKNLGQDQYIEPYFISSHPGSTLEDALELACFMRDTNTHPKQVQDFYPTPSTISTCMYYTGLDPRNMKHIHIPTNEEKRMQRALLQYREPRNHDLVIRALQRARRTDLIGFDKDSLVGPRSIESKKPDRGSKAQTTKRRNSKDVTKGQKGKKDSTAKNKSEYKSEKKQNENAKSNQKSKLDNKLNSTPKSKQSNKPNSNPKYKKDSNKSGNTKKSKYDNQESTQSSSPKYYQNIKTKGNSRRKKHK